MQRGFTEKISSLNTAFIVSQTSEHYQDLLEKLIHTTLDTQKAFDKLQHEILFNKIYHDGITGNIYVVLVTKYVQECD